MPLLKGPGTVKKNVQELMGKVQSPARKKAIATISRTRNINRDQAKFIQARAIAATQARKK